MSADRSDDNDIGETIPRGVVNVQHRTVGVPDQTPNFLRQISFLRSEVAKLEEHCRRVRKLKHRPATYISDRGERGPLSEMPGASAIGLLAFFGLVLLASRGLTAARGSRGSVKSQHLKGTFLRAGKDAIST